MAYSLSPPSFGKNMLDLRSKDDTVNVGTKWMIEEDNRLVQEIKEKKTYEEIALEHKRTVHGIQRRLFLLIDDDEEDDGSLLSIPDNSSFFLFRSCSSFSFFACNFIYANLCFCSSSSLFLSSIYLFRSSSLSSFCRLIFSSLNFCSFIYFSFIALYSSNISC
jgi:hypothetical protein